MLPAPRPGYVRRSVAAVWALPGTGGTHDGRQVRRRGLADDGHGRRHVSAMARELVERSGVRETADNVRRALTREHQKLFPTSSPVAPGPAKLLQHHSHSARSLIHPRSRPQSAAIKSLYSDNGQRRCTADGASGLPFPNRHRCSVRPSRAPPPTKTELQLRAISTLGLATTPFSRLRCPIFRWCLDAPHVARPIKRQSEQPQFHIFSQRNAVDHPRSYPGFEGGKTVQLNGSPNL